MSVVIPLAIISTDLFVPSVKARASILLPVLVLPLHRTHCLTSDVHLEAHLIVHIKSLLSGVILLRHPSIVRTLMRPLSISWILVRWRSIRDPLIQDHIVSLPLEQINHTTVYLAFDQMIHFLHLIIFGRGSEFDYGVYDMLPRHHRSMSVEWNLACMISQINLCFHYRWG